MKNAPIVFVAPIGAGIIFTGLFLAAWIAYFWGDGDGERAAVCTAFELFAGPLLLGSVLALRGRRFGLHLLRFGSVLFIFEPMTLCSLWELEDDPQYIEYLSRRNR